MSNVNLLILFVFTLALWSCGPCDKCQNVDEKQEVLLEREQALDAREKALAEREVQLEQTTTTPTATTEQDVPDNQVDETVASADHPVRLGAHNITLQWISWDHPGTAEVTFINKDRYKIVGEQRSKENDDYLVIDGSLVPQDDRTFLFEGRIEYLVSHNNGGEACIKTGPLHFKTSGQRKYWRLQEKTNCEGGMLTDYVDIYF